VGEGEKDIDYNKSSQAAGHRMESGSFQKREGGEREPKSEGNREGAEPLDVQWGQKSEDKFKPKVKSGSWSAIDH